MNKYCRAAQVDFNEAVVYYYFAKIISFYEFLKQMKGTYSKMSPFPYPKSYRI